MDFFNTYRRQFLQYLEQREVAADPQNLYDPVNYILELGGKRLRPVAVLIAHELFGGAVPPALPIALAVETFHNFTLMHDDIMDQAPLRRGKVTVHEKYDLNTAILSGDVMLILAYQYFLEVEDKQKALSLLKVFTQVAKEVCEGQQMDMDFENRSDVTLQEYLRMIELKTAVLFAGALQMGAILAGATTKDQELLYQFGRDIGIAFQLQDDLLDTFGDPEKFGKKVGGDISQNKKTVLVLKVLEMGTPTAVASLQKWMQTNPEDDTEKIAAVKQLFEETGVRRATEMLKDEYRSAAFEALAKVEGSEAVKRQLQQLSDYFLGREV